MYHVHVWDRGTFLFTLTQDSLDDARKEYAFFAAAREYDVILQSVTTYGTEEISSCSGRQ